MGRFSQMQLKATPKPRPLQGGLVQHDKQMLYRSSDIREGFEVPAVVQEVLHSPGQPLDQSTRSFMQSRFGHDFSRVRIHSDAKAANSAEAVNARAYTVGRNIVFGPGEYVRGSTASRGLLAHELTHVVQQSRGTAATRHPPGVLMRKPKDSPALQPEAGRSRVTLFGDIETWYVLDGFETKKSDLIPPHLAIIERVAEDLTNHPLVLGGFVTVVGYADKVPSTDPDNRALGQMRADTVRNALLERGVSASDVRAYSLGDETPAVETAKAEPRNRRVTISVTRRSLPSVAPFEPAPELGDQPEPPAAEPPVFDPLKQPLCVVYPKLCEPETPEEAGRRILKPIPPPPTTREALQELARWLTRDVPIPNWMVKIAEAVGVENARKKLREALEKGGEEGLKKALEELVKAAVGPPTGRPSEGPHQPEISPPTIFKLPPIPIPGPF